MSRIFEALQHAEKERRQRKSVEDQIRIPRGNVDRTLAIDTADPHQCMDYAARVSREGLLDFLSGLVGMYPWQCSHCHRCFRRFQR